VFFAVIVMIVLLVMLFVRRQRRKNVDDSANSSSYISENKHACSGNFCCRIDVLVIIGSTHFLPDFTDFLTQVGPFVYSLAFFE